MKYRPKLTRPKQGEEGYRKPPNLNLQQRDVEILDLCWQHRFLTSSQIHALLGESWERDKRNLRRRLQLLWLHRLLDRPKDQEILRIREGLRDLIYALGDKGAKALAQHKGYDIERIRWTQKNDQITFPYIKHALFISQFFTCLALALKERPGHKIIFWRQGRQIHDRIKRPSYIPFEDVRSERPTLRPDALFCLLYPDNRKQYFFLEADLSTIREKSMLTRYRKYWSYWQQKGFSRFEIPERQGFRVLTLSNTEARRENLRRLINNNEPWRGKTSMFWFSSECWSLKEPELVLERWRTADEDWHSLLE